MKTLKKIKINNKEIQVWYVKKGEYNYLIQSKNNFDSGVIYSTSIKNAIKQALVRARNIK